MKLNKLKEELEEKQKERNDKTEQKAIDLINKYDMSKGMLDDAIIISPKHMKKVIRKVIKETVK